MSGYARRIYLGIEFVFLFFGIPLILLGSMKILHPSAILIPIVLILIYYLKKQRLHWRELRSIRIDKRFLNVNVLLIVLSSVIIFAWVYFSFKDDLFNLPSSNFKIWLLLFLFYPLFSASLQEIVYRVFMFRRYHPLFFKPWMLIVASGIAFSFAHIFYLNAISLILTLIMGIYLAYLYFKTKSFLLVALIHSFYGNFIFTIGLGEHFWIDMHKYLM
ncbi:MAG TPA: CPBP family intramembrane glutamic endopeptidase [Bacteroidales bacterium]|nr:CPBP family intramembrane glutamic endopeptidase [Bacteroidales bacterium]